MARKMNKKIRRFEKDRKDVKSCITIIYSLSRNFYQVTAIFPIFDATNHLMKRIIVFLALIIASGMAGAQSVSPSQAQRAAERMIQRMGKEKSCSIGQIESINQFSGPALGYLCTLHPAGFMVISAREELPPVVFYSFTGCPDPEGRLLSLLRTDLSLRLQYQPETTTICNRQSWKQLESGEKRTVLFQQWPEPGTTSTEGWLETNWTQSAPYNQLCPLDPVTSTRSIAGCPAVAMAQIVNFHQTTNGVVFDDGDDYYHHYAGRNYYIDDDHETMDFPSFPVLNAYLDTLSMAWAGGNPPKNREMAALTFACGVAATQVFTSSASGTFGVVQAFDAYQKFNFDEAQLVTVSDSVLYAHMAQNIKDTLPIHLAIVDSAWSMGHNVVVDGYNTDEYFHLNFGWGGPYNGWYLLPEGIPYGLTVIEGVILDIIPDHTAFVPEPPAVTRSFYPNPASDFICLNPSSGITRAELFTCDGRLLRALIPDANGTTINLSDLPEGFYLIRWWSKQSMRTEKLTIKR